MNDEDFKEIEKELEKQYSKQKLAEIKAGLEYLQTLKKELKDKRDRIEEVE